MSAPIAVTAAPGALRPRFQGILWGELFNMAQQWITWVGVVIAIMPAVVYTLSLYTVQGLKADILTDPYQYLYIEMGRELAIIRVFIGFLLMVITILAVGLDYQQGTIRIVLARGVGRLQLLMAKLLAIVALALAVFVVYCALILLLNYVVLGQIAGSFHIFAVLDARFWHDTFVYLLTVLVSMGVTILMALAVTVLGRSLAFGMGVGLLFFPADNIGTVVMAQIYGFTHHDFWLKVPAYLLGPNLNAMPSLLVPPITVTVPGKAGALHMITQYAPSLGVAPSGAYDGTHALVVALVYALVFVLVAGVLIWRRDVME